jgi:aspartokinase
MRNISIQKIGGENATEMNANADRARAYAREGGDQVIVLSAMKDPEYQVPGKKVIGFNTTSTLNAAAQNVQSGDTDSALELIKDISEFTRSILQREIEKDLHPELEAVLSGVITELTTVLTSATEITSTGSDYHTEDGTSITAYGEQLSRRLHVRLFELLGIQSQELQLNSTEDFQAELTNFRGGIGITGGHTAELSNERGYSDLKAAAIARTFDFNGVDTRLIVTKQFSLHSADPRQIQGTTPIGAMSADVARTAFAANGVVQSNVMDMLDGTNVKIQILNSNTGESTWVLPDANIPFGSVQLIHYEVSEGDRVHAQLIGPEVNGPVTRATTEFLTERGVSDFSHYDGANVVHFSLPSDAHMQELHDHLTQ